MSDPTHDPTLLASVYLDGEASADERARVEADPELLAEVEQLRRLRAVVADVEPAPISMRERHLAAALDVFDRMPATDSGRDVTPAGREAAIAAAVTAPTPIRRERRPGGTPRWLLGAAAGLIVVVGGAAVVRNVGTDDSGDDSVALDAADGGAAERSDDPADLIPEMAADELAGDATVAPLPLPEGAEAETGDDLAASSATEAMVAEEEPAEEAAAEPTDDDAADGADADEPPPEGQFENRPEIDLVELETRADLADFGAFAVDAPASETPVDPAFEVCRDEFSIDLVVGPASFRGADVIVGVDLDRAVVIAYDDECRQVEAAPLP